MVLFFADQNAVRRASTGFVPKQRFVAHRKTNNIISTLFK